MFRVNFEKQLPNIRVALEMKVAQKEIHGIMGPIGSGKTTILNMVAGLLDPDRGEIIKDDEILFSSFDKINIPSYKRKIGYCFQKPALFPHLTVRENIGYALFEKDSDKIKELAAMFSLERLLNRYPKNLSGGESQKVALARAMASDPQVLLLDEPFASIDSTTKKYLQDTVLEISKQKVIPIIFVTHDQAEGEKLFSRVTYLKDSF